MTTWNIESVTGYKPITTFWEDFTIADMFGVAAIKDTYERAFDEWKSDYKYLTELSMVLNHKIWYWWQRNDTYARLYDTLWRQTHAWAYDNLRGEELSYYHWTLD